MRTASFLDASFLNLHRREMEHTVSEVLSKSQILGRHPTRLYSVTKTLNYRYIHNHFGWFCSRLSDITHGKMPGLPCDSKKSSRQPQITYMRAGYTPGTGCQDLSDCQITNPALRMTKGHS